MHIKRTLNLILLIFPLFLGILSGYELWQIYLCSPTCEEYHFGTEQGWVYQSLYTYTLCNLLRFILFFLNVILLFSKKPKKIKFIGILILSILSYSLPFLPV